MQQDGQPFIQCRQAAVLAASRIPADSTPGGWNDELTMAQPATTQRFYCPAATFGVIKPM